MSHPLMACMPSSCWCALYDSKAFDECRLVTLPQTSLLVNERCRYCRELVIEKRPKFKLSSLANHHQTNKYVLEVDCWLVRVPFGLRGVTHRLDGTADGGIEPTRETCTVGFCHPHLRQVFVMKMFGMTFRSCFRERITATFEL